MSADRRIEVRVATRDGAELVGDLVVPPRPVGVVAFAHGGGGGRASPRDRRVAAELRDAGIATLLMAPRDHEEEWVGAGGGDVALLARRLADAIDWLRDAPVVGGLPIGLHGAGIAAAAALLAAAESPQLVAAVVSRGGRPDLAGEALDRVRAPTLLIVGGDDAPVIGINGSALRRLGPRSRLHVLPGGDDIAGPPGALDEAAVLARDWFRERLVPVPVAAGRTPDEPRHPPKEEP